MKGIFFWLPVATIFLLFLEGFSGCKHNPPKEGMPIVMQDTLPKYNIIVLLDLSDRVLADNQVVRDRKIIEQIYKVFNSIAGDEAKVFYDSKDKICVKILEQQNTPYAKCIPAWEDTMYIDMERISFVDNSFDNRAKRNQSFLRTVETVYSTCLLPKREDFSGANIQKYFKQDLIKDLDTTARNKIFILTDGYPVVEGKSVRIRELENLDGKFSSYKEFIDVYFLELRPKDDPKDEEYPSMVKSWCFWLSEAGFKTENDNYFQKNTTNLNTLEERINAAFGVTSPSPKATSEAMPNPVVLQGEESNGDFNKDIHSLISNATNLSPVEKDKSIDDLKAKCGVAEIIVDDGGAIKKSLRSFLSTKSAEKYNMQVLPIKGKILEIKVTKL